MLEQRNFTISRSIFSKQMLGIPPKHFGNVKIIFIRERFCTPRQYCAEIDFLIFFFFIKKKCGCYALVDGIADPLPWGVVRLKRDVVTDFRKNFLMQNPKLALPILSTPESIFLSQKFSLIFPRTQKFRDRCFPLLARERKLLDIFLMAAWFNVSDSNMFESAQRHFSADHS